MDHSSASYDLKLPISVINDTFADAEGDALFDFVEGLYDIEFDTLDV